jgi:hypothetical protein
MTCLSGWIYHRGSCFKISSTTSSIYTISNVTLLSGCYNLSSTRLAILEDTDATISSFTSAFAYDSYFDGYLNTKGASGNIQFDSFFTPGFLITVNNANANYWSISAVPTDLCARFPTFPTNSSITQQFKSCSCNDTKNWICEYKL